MWNLKVTYPGCCPHLLVVFFFSLVVVSRSVEVKDFIAVNTLPDGEVETRIYFKGVAAKETTVAKGSNSGITFRQLVDKKRFIQLIYDKDAVLTDCEIVHQREQVNKFLVAFKSDLSNLLATSNVTVESLDYKPLPSEVTTWFNFTLMKNQCKTLHKELKRAAKLMAQNQKHDTRSLRRMERSFFIMPGTLWCGPSHRAATYTELGGLSETDKCCRKHDHCRMFIPSYTTRFKLYNHTPFTQLHCRCDLRQRRDVYDILRVPGTKWCGKGYSADKYTRLGGFSRTDKCCRRHDMSCPFWIGGFETKYGLFNWRVNTIMHCSCDERFRACLKMVGSSDANLVGKLFFNVVQSKCFVLKPKKRCTRMSWWGKCEKFKYEKHAILRDNLAF